MPEVELVPSKVTSLETLAKGKPLLGKRIFMVTVNAITCAVRQFLERMGRVAFFRSGNEPIVLNEEQRDARKAAFIRQMSEKKGMGRRLNQVSGCATHTRTRTRTHTYSYSRLQMRASREVCALKKHFASLACDSFQLPTSFFRLSPISVLWSQIRRVSTTSLTPCHR